MLLSTTATGSSQTETLAPLDGGSQTLTITATDAAGNSASDTLLIEIDATAPTAAITYSSDGPYPQDTTITLTATFDEALKDSPVPQIAISGSNSLGASDMTKVSSTVYSYDFTVGSGDGIATVTLATAQDLAGNVVTSTPTSGGTFTVDNTAPSVSADSITSPTNDNTPNLTITAESGSTIAVTSDGTSGNVGTATGTGSSQIITLSTLDEGTQTLTVTATDAAGNSDTDTISVTVDTTAPVITLAGDNPQTVELGSSYSESGASTDDGTSVTIDSSAVNTSVVGSYTVTYDATDAAGNAATQVTRTVNVVDTTAPVVTITGYNPHPYELGSSYTQTAASNEALKSVTVHQFTI